MFNGCSSMSIAPVLLATTLVTGCYVEMFHNCYGLHYINCLATNPATTNVENSSTGSWVYNVSATDTFVKDANATWSIGNSGIPSGWKVMDAD